MLSAGLKMSAAIMLNMLACTHIQMLQQARNGWQSSVADMGLTFMLLGHQLVLCQLCLML